MDDSRRAGPTVAEHDGNEQRRTDRNAGGDGKADHGHVARRVGHALAKLAHVVLQSREEREGRRAENGDDLGERRDDRAIRERVQAEGRRPEHGPDEDVVHVLASVADHAVARDVGPEPEQRARASAIPGKRRPPDRGANGERPGQRVYLVGQRPEFAGVFGILQVHEGA